MPNGNRGDHPLTDIVHYGKSVFGPELDTLIRAVDQYGYWKNQIASLYMLDVERRARDAGALPAASAASIASRPLGQLSPIEIELNNLRFTLEFELLRLKDAAR